MIHAINCDSGTCPDTYWTDPVLFMITLVSNAFIFGTCHDTYWTDPVLFMITLVSNAFIFGTRRWIFTVKEKFI